MPIDIVEVLKNLEEDAIVAIVDFLNDHGIVCDEDIATLSSHVIKHWDEDCDHFLIENGYLGGSLSKYGIFSNEIGSLHCLFDSEEQCLDDAKIYLNHFIELNKSKYQD